MANIPPVNSSRYTAFRRSLQHRAREQTNTLEASRNPVKRQANRRKHGDRRRSQKTVKLDRRQAHRRGATQVSILKKNEDSNSKGWNINTTA